MIEMQGMLQLPTDLTRRYRYRFQTNLRFSKWEYDYILIGAKGGVHLHVSGPHNYDNEDHWTAGLELHSRTPLYDDTPPSHDECWLLKCPCWHDGTSTYAMEHFLPMALRGNHDGIFRSLISWADGHFKDKES